jgi:hypothetical protein
MTITRSKTAMANAERRAHEADAAAYLEDCLGTEEDPADGFTDADIDATLAVAQADIAAGRVYSVDEVIDRVLNNHNPPGSEWLPDSSDPLRQMPRGVADSVERGRRRRGGDGIPAAAGRLQTALGVRTGLSESCVLQKPPPPRKLQ